MLDKLQKKSWVVFLGLALLTVSGAVVAGSLEPSGPPAPTMKTLNQIPPTWDQILPSNLPANDPNNRFQSALDGTAILDKETGLVWEKTPATFSVYWEEAKFLCLKRITGGRLGWRLPLLEELASLLALGTSAPPLPTGHPFTIQNEEYWTATIDSLDPKKRSYVNFSSLLMIGQAFIDPPDKARHIWCVRGPSVSSH